MEGGRGWKRVEEVEVSSHNGETGSHHCHAAGASCTSSAPPRKLEISLNNDALKKLPDFNFQVQTMTVRGKRPSAVMPLLSLVFDIDTETDGGLEEFGTHLVTIEVKKQQKNKPNWNGRL